MADDKFIRIAVTVPYFYPGEAADIERKLLDGEADYVHARKPGAESDRITSLIRDIDPALRPRLTLHDHFELATLLGTGGIHLNSRNSTVPAWWKGRVSRSCHTVGECLTSHGFDYVTLSPVFPSISKPGYKPTLDPQELHTLLSSHRTTKIVALGGITPERLEAVREAGFDGAAMLGAAWSKPLDRKAFRLQFITNPCSVESATNQVRDALKGGCRWIQLRWKNAGIEDIVMAAREIAPMCRKAGAVFLLDDHVELVGRCDADGVHVGKNDMPPSQARLILGPSKIIGATANTPADIDRAAAEGADYVGYGPFRFTTTKKNLSPVLGLEGYRTAVAHMKGTGIGLPVVAIGGITGRDITDIMGTEVNGIAVSGVITGAPDPAEVTTSLINKLNE